MRSDYNMNSSRECAVLILLLYTPTVCSQLTRVPILYFF